MEFLLKIWANLENLVNSSSSRGKWKGTHIEKNIQTRRLNKSKIGHSTDSGLDVRDFRCSKNGNVTGLNSSAPRLPPRILPSCFRWPNLERAQAGVFQVNVQATISRPVKGCAHQSAPLNGRRLFTTEFLSPKGSKPPNSFCSPLFTSCFLQFVFSIITQGNNFRGAMPCNMSNVSNWLTNGPTNQATNGSAN